MSTNAPTPPPTHAGIPPDLVKAFTQTVQGLATAYNICHQLQPDSPACEALMELQRAVAEIQSHVGAGGEAEGAAEPGDSPQEDSAEQIQSQMPPQGGGPFAQAAQAAHAQILANSGGMQ